MYGATLETLSVSVPATTARWAAVREEPFARDADARGESDTFLFGDRETYADVVAACWLGWARRIWSLERRYTGVGRAGNVAWWAVGTSQARLQEMGIRGYSGCARLCQVSISPF